MFASRENPKAFSGVRRNDDHSFESGKTRAESFNRVPNRTWSTGICGDTRWSNSRDSHTITQFESIILMHKNNEIYADPFIKINLEINSSLKKDSKYKITELKKCLIMR